MKTEDVQSLLDGATKGPWELCDQGDYGDFDGNSRVILGNDMRIAVVHVNTYNKEGNFTARLIAAAPTLAADLIAANAEIERITDERNRMVDRWEAQNAEIERRNND